MLRTTMMALSPLLFLLFALTTLAGSIGILLAVFATVGVIDTDVPVFIPLLGLVLGVALAAIPVLAVTRVTFTPRVRFAIITLYIGLTGLDLLLYGKEQRLLFLFAMGLYLLMFLGFTLLGVYSLLLTGLLGLWWQARFFECLYMTDEDFDRLRRGEYKG